MPAPLVEMTGISKRFPGVVANDQVHLAVRAGEVRALLGENGAGKTTLVSILAGLYQPDAGAIFWKGRRVALRSPRDASRLGIGMVHQHFKLVPSFTATENVLLGSSGTQHLAHALEVRRRLRQLGQEYGLDVDPDVPIWQLSVGEQQRVELLRQLYMGADLLILDEPTAALTPQESRHLFGVLRTMAAQGHGLIVITHKLPEVMSAADTITVLRHGRVMGEFVRTETDERTLASLMIGRSPREMSFASRSPPGLPIMTMHEVGCLSDRGYPALRGASLEVRVGSILGVAGVAGNGQRELAQVLTGLRRITSGRIRVGGLDLTGAEPDEFLRAGVLHVPEDRLGTGLAPGLSVWENLSLRIYRRPPFVKRGLLNLRLARSRAMDLAIRFDVRVPSVDFPVRYLSGGNLQKAIVAREISAGPRVLVAADPTRGLDIAATELVHRYLLEERQAGVAVLLISEDLDELLLLADRILVLYRGQVMGLTDAATADRQQLGLWMAGVRSEAEA